MRLFSPDPFSARPLPGSHAQPGSSAFSFRTRLAQALCREGPGGTRVDDTIKRTRHSQREHPEPGFVYECQECSQEDGSAVVEFTFLALLLMVPLVYFVITVGQIQGGSFAVVGAADQAAKVYVAQPDAPAAQAAAEQAVALALSDFGHAAEMASMTTSCSPANCQAAGTAVTVTVRLNVPLPFIPFADGLSATEVEASSTQLVGRYR
jgi:hypothetical protein